MSELPFKIIKLNYLDYRGLIEKRDNTLYIVLEENRLPRFYFGDQLVSGLEPGALENILSEIGIGENDINHIKDGTTVVKKAEEDQSGQNIKSTYIKNIELEYDQTQNKINLIKVFGDDSKSLPVSFVVPEATNYNDGLLTKEDKNKIDNIAADIAAMGSTKVPLSQKNQTNGYAGLDANAKIPLALLYDSVLGQVEYAGEFNASLGTFPTMTNALAPNDRPISKGDYFITNVAGTVGGFDFNVGDWLIRHASRWGKVDNTDAVASVNGKLGVVVINGTDVLVGNGDTFTVEQRIVSMIADIDNRYTKTEVDALKVNKTTTVNGKELSTDITLYGSDISSDMFQGESVDDVLVRLNQAFTNSAPQTRKVAGKALSSDIVLNASDIQFGQSTVEVKLDYIDDTKADQATTLAGYGITDAYTKAEVDNRTTAIYRVKGNVSTYASLPSTGQITGDVYNVVDTGINYVWNGTIWDDIGGVEAMATASEDGLMSKEDKNKVNLIDTEGDGTKYFGDDGQYHTLTNVTTADIVTGTATTQKTVTAKAVHDAIMQIMFDSLGGES